LASGLCRLRFGESTAQLQVKADVAAEALEILHSPTDLADQRVAGANLSPEEEANHFSFSRCEDVTSHGLSEITSVEKALNILPLCNSNCQVCVSERETKNLAKVERQQKGKCT